MRSIGGKGRLLGLVTLVLLAAAMPATWADVRAQTGQAPFDQPGPSASWADVAGAGGEFSAAFVQIGEVNGEIGDVDLKVDTPEEPGAACGTYRHLDPALMEISVAAPVVSVAGSTSQTITFALLVYQILPDGSIAFAGATDEVPYAAEPGQPLDIEFFTIFDVPVGPIWLAVLQVAWYDDVNADPSGWALYQPEYYSTWVNDGGEWQFLEVTDACYPLVAPVASLNPTSGNVRQTIQYDVGYFPVEYPIDIRWDSNSLGTVDTDFFGEATGSFGAPDGQTMGEHTVSFTAGEWQAQATFTIKPRIKLTPGEASRGDTVGVSLRGYKARETVRIRWKQGDAWVELARVTTSGTGSANLNVVVPEWAPVGPNSVRGDSTSSSGGRAQTNAFSVDDEPLPEPGTLLLSSNRGTVNSRVTATVGNFPPNETATVTFRGFYEATASAMTDATGAATMAFNVPASPKGFHTVDAIGGNVEATATYEIVPRIKLTPGQAGRGDTIGVSLRGYGAREIVRIRWQLDGSFEQLTTVTTSSSGSANLNITVPLSALDGPASVRGDGPIGRAQTNAFVVSGGPFEPAAVAEPSSTPTVTPTETPLPASPTTEPTVTEEPTQEPTATPTEEPPAEPTATPETPTDPPADPPAEASPSPETAEETTT